MQNCILVSIVIATQVTAQPATAEEPVFIGMLADGTPISEAKLTAGDALAKATLDQHRLLFEANPIRWLRNKSVRRPIASGAFIELISGDRLPLNRLATSGNLTDGLPLPPHILVETSYGAHSDRETGDRMVRILTRFVRRIVLQQRAVDQYQPGSLFLRDGQQHSFRSIRFSGDFVIALTDQQSLRIALDDVAEAHLPHIDPWRAWYEQLACLCPDVSVPLLHWEMFDGARLTTSPYRVRPENGDSTAGVDWTYEIQPAWSLDPIQVRGTNLYRLRIEEPHDVPLSVIAPTKVRHKPVFSTGLRPRVDSNVRGKRLVCGGREYTTGFGVAGSSELHFALPRCVESFRSRVGLDAAAGDGGCVRCEVYVNESGGSPLYRSQHLIGSGKSVDTGRIALHGPTRGQNHLVLVTDSASTDRPSGADPFDVRDFADWLEPRLRLRPDELQAEVRGCLPTMLSGHDDWTASPEDLDSVIIQNYWEHAESGRGRYGLRIQPRDAFLTLSRKMFLPADDDWLLIYASCHRAESSGLPARMQVRLDGRAVAEFELPERLASGAPVPLVAPIDRYHGRQVAVELLLIPGDQSNWIYWDSVRTGHRPPVLLEVFSENLRLADTNSPSLIESDAYSGTKCARAGVAAIRQRLSALNVPIRERPQPGEYRYLCFAWRKQGGTSIGLDLAILPRREKIDGEFPSATHHQYVSGPRRIPSAEAHVNSIAKEIPTQWTLVTRDLYRDLGPVQLREISATCPDGDFALLDHVFLARTMEDFDHCPAPTGKATHYIDDSKGR